MDIVLGVSMVPSTVQMVLVEGENADGVTVEEDHFEILTEADPPTRSASDQVVAAIVGTGEGAAQGGYQLASTGVTWTDPIEARALRDALAARKVENVMLVSAFVATAALARTVGSGLGYAHTGLLFVEPDTATLAVVDNADGSIAEVRQEPLPDDDTEAVARITAMTSSADGLESGPEGLFVVGSGVDIGMIRSELEAATSLAVNVPDEPETALARGAALASAHAPLFVESATAALAYALDPGTGAVHPELALAAAEQLAYSADPVGDADQAGLDFDVDDEEQRERKPFLVVLGALTIFVVGVAALAIALALDIRPHVNQRPNLGQNIVVPTRQAPPPPPAPPPQAPAPVPAPAPAAPAPAPAPAAPPPPPAFPPAPALPPLPPPILPVPRPLMPGPRLPGPGIPLPGIGGPHLPGLPGFPHL